jgi:AraC family transcriptional regulator
MDDQHLSYQRSDYQPLEPVPAPRYDDVGLRFETLLSSEGRNWKNLQLYSYKLEPQPEPVVAPIIEAHTIPVLLKGTTKLSAFSDGRVVREQVYPGSMSLTPRGVSTAYSWTNSAVVANLFVLPDLIRAVAEDFSYRNSEQAELVHSPFFRDPFIEQICLALVRELETQGLLGSLYADTLAQALALHLLRHYSSLSTTKDLPERGLSQGQLRLVRDFINDYLGNEIRLEELAALTHSSPSHFTKQFKCSTGLPPHQYLIQQRVERAKELLSTSELSIAEVSQVVGFFDQSHLVRHFKYWVGVTPKDYRDSKLKN